MKNALFVLGMLVALCGCATGGPQVASDDASIRVAPTGSNMVRKDSTLRSHGITAVDREGMEEARRNAIALPPTGGAAR